MGADQLNLLPNSILLLINSAPFSNKFSNFKDLNSVHPEERIIRTGAKISSNIYIFLKTC